MFSRTSCQDCPYTILGISRNAMMIEIKRAYHSQSRNSHPDRLANAPAAERHAGRERMKSINHAYEILTNPAQRTEHDRAHPPQTLTQPRPYSSQGYPAQRRKPDSPRPSTAPNPPPRQAPRPPPTANRSETRAPPPKRQKTYSYHQELTPPQGSMGWVAAGHRISKFSTSTT
jgi:curved DNA-binding protein CbpA